MDVEEQPIPWRELIAIGAIAGAIEARSIARYSGVHLAVAEQSLKIAVEQGVLCDGQLSHADRARLIAELDPDTTARVHAAVARHLMTEGAAMIPRAIEHAHAAGTLIPLEELVSVADHCARTSLSISEYEDARQLLELADELDLGSDQVRRAQRLLRLAQAHHGLGQIERARELLQRSFNIAVLTGDVGLAVEAATMHAFPADWYAGDPRSTALLQMADGLDLDPEQRVLVDAARAVVEMRLPLPGQSHQQVAWVTRASVAQPLSERALTASAEMAPDTRLIALIAWRNTHRAPRHLAERRERSAEALDLAQTIRSPRRQVLAAAMLAADAIESGDPGLYEQALTVARWVADRDGNPHLLWYATTLAAGAAYLEGAVEAGHHLRRQARAHGRKCSAPGWFAADSLFAGQEILHHDDPEEMRPYLDLGDEILVSPIGKLFVARVAARLGESSRAVDLARSALVHLDEESSYLFMASMISAVAIGADDTTLAADMVTVLEPWSDRVAIDSNAWWCEGPVALRLAELNQYLDNPTTARRYLDEAEPIARALNDARSLTRADDLRRVLDTTLLGSRRGIDIRAHGGDDVVDPRLTDRERVVLSLMAEGLTNAQIAERLAYSLSTIRVDTMSIYRKLGVRGRVEAVALLADAGQ